MKRKEEHIISLKEGRHEGRTDGRKQGRKDGRADGRKEGGEGGCSGGQSILSRAYSRDCGVVGGPHRSAGTAWDAFPRSPWLRAGIGRTRDPDPSLSMHTVMPGLVTTLLHSCHPSTTPPEFLVTWAIAGSSCRICSSGPGSPFPAPGLPDSRTPGLILSSMRLAAAACGAGSGRGVEHELVARETLSLGD
jgi:hypothetical protein